MGLSFYRCPVCGEMVLMVKKAKCTPCCCGKEMVELVKVGSVEHPMAEEHYIEFIAVERKDGFDLKYLKPGEKPEAQFAAEGAVAAYAYCNLHGLWKADL